MFLASCGFTPQEIDEEWTWPEIEAFLTVYPYVETQFGGLQHG